VTGTAAEAVSVAVLGVALLGAIVRPLGWYEAVFAVPGALLLVLLGVVPWSRVDATVRELGPTVLFLAGILLFGHLCAEAGVFDYLGAVAAQVSGGRPPRLLATVVALAAGVTAVLTLDATVVLLTPVVRRTTRRLRVPSRPHLYACAHLANSGSLLLPVSNLTNLLAFTATGLSFVHFAALMVLPWLVACALDGLALRWYFRGDLRTSSSEYVERPRPPRYALTILGLTVAGFVVTSAAGLSPAWAAWAGVVVLAAPALRARRTTPWVLAGEANPGFVLFVLALGVIFEGVRAGGLATALGHLVPDGTSLPALIATALLAAALANLINNIPATLALLPLVAGSPLAALAMLVGVNLGPNLTFVGSLATLLWRRQLDPPDHPSGRTFHVLGALSTVPLVLAATVTVWAAAIVVGG
jgi:arsenical pump membrane protein